MKNKKFDRLFMVFLILCSASVIPFIVSLETTVEYLVNGIGKPSYVAIFITIGFLITIYTITKIMFYEPPSLIELRQKKIKRIQK